MSTLAAHLERLLPATPEAEETDAERHLRVVEPRTRFRPRVALWLGSLVAVGSLFLLVAFNVFMVQGQFRLDRISQQRAIEQNLYEQNRLAVAQASAPQTILAKASALGLIPATQLNYIFAPAAAPKQTSVDATSSTLAHSYAYTKKHLEPGG
jgi:hypothetical protein